MSTRESRSLSISRYLFYVLTLRMRILRMMVKCTALDVDGDDSNNNNDKNVLHLYSPESFPLQLSVTFSHSHCTSLLSSRGVKQLLLFGVSQQIRARNPTEWCGRLCNTSELWNTWEAPGLGCRNWREAWCSIRTEHTSWLGNVDPSPKRFCGQRLVLM